MVCKRPAFGVRFQSFNNTESWLTRDCDIDLIVLCGRMVNGDPSLGGSIATNPCRCLAQSRARKAASAISGDLPEQILEVGLRLNLDLE